MTIPSARFSVAVDGQTLDLSFDPWYDDGWAYLMDYNGALTIRDVTKAVVLEAEYAGQAKDPWGNQRVAFTAKTAVDRREFGLTWNQVLEAGGVLVGERIEIELEVQAVQAAEAKVA